MTRPVVWSPTARQDVLAIAQFIAADNPAAARSVTAKLRATAEALGPAPTGRPGRVTGTFEKSVSGLPYIIAYERLSRSGGEVVAILHIIHTARHWPSGSWPA